MLAGAVFACKPSNLAKNGAQSVANAAGKEIIGTAISKAETAVIKNVMTTGARLGNKGSVQKTVQIAERNLESSFKSSQWKFPKNPNELLKELPRNAKGEIHVCDNLRIRPEKHAFQAGDRYNPRHHEQHYHVEFRRNPKGKWKNSNVEILKPPGYEPNSGTGFLPSELFPGL